MRNIVCLSGAIGMLALLMPASSRAHTPVTAVTWVDDVGPIVQSRCVPCHGAPARSSLRLDSYEAAHDAARRIKREVLMRRMPPWPAAAGFGDYENDPSLSQLETELLAAWADGGAPRGEGADPLTRPPNGRAWRAPDLVLRAPSSGVVRDASRTIEVATERTTDAWIEAWEFRPGNPMIVQQAELAIVGGDPIGVWVPPNGVRRFAAGIAQRLPANARVSLKILYQKRSVPEADDSSIALYFTRPPAQAVRHLPLRCGTATLAEAMDVLTVRPIAGRSGASIDALAREPSGRAVPLVWVPAYVLRFEPAYRFRVPPSLPRGTQITLSSSDQACRADVTYVVANPPRPGRPRQQAP